MKAPQKEWSGKVSEKIFMAQVRQLARHCGWMSYHTFNSFRSTEGFPDLVLLRPERLIFAELKSEKGKLSPAQQTWLNSLKLLPAVVETYTWRPSDFDAIVRILR